MTYKDLEQASDSYAKAVIQHLTTLSEKLPRETEVEPAPPVWSKGALEPFYRSFMMRSLLQLVAVAPPTE